MKIRIKTLAACVLIAAMVLSNTSVALADGDEYVVRPDLGLDVEGFTPGEGGYKVFGPNAFGIQPIVGEQRHDGDSLDTYYRTHVTDIWEKDGSTVMASHLSMSDLFEDEIWVDGAIKISGQGWYMSDDDHTSGMFAHVNTEMPDPQFSQTFIAHSWHHFHTSGWVDLNNETEDNIVT